MSTQQRKAVEDVAREKHHLDIPTDLSKLMVEYARVPVWKRWSQGRSLNATVNVFNPAQVVLRRAPWYERASRSVAVGKYLFHAGNRYGVRMHLVNHGWAPVMIRVGVLCVTTATHAARYPPIGFDFLLSASSHEEVLLLLNFSDRQVSMSKCGTLMIRGGPAVRYTPLNLNIDPPARLWLSTPHSNNADVIASIEDITLM